MPTITINTDAKSLAGDLQVVVTQPSTSTVYEGSVNELQARIAAYAGQIADIQAQQAADEALLARIQAQFTAQNISL